jgi:hypothetical protein
MESSPVDMKDKEEKRKYAGDQKPDLGFSLPLARGKESYSRLKKGDGNVTYMRELQCYSFFYAVCLVLFRYPLSFCLFGGGCGVCMIPSHFYSFSFFPFLFFSNGWVGLGTSS